MTSTRWSEPAFQSIADALRARTGLTLSTARPIDVETGVRQAMRKAGIASASTYRDRLMAGLVPLDDLVADLTVGETYFFREPRQFEFIRRDVLPTLARCRSPDHVLRIWSAGCASGEEAYSLAILLEEEGLHRRAEILGTDISPAALAKARAATYGRWSLRGCDAAAVGRYFRRAGKRFVLADRFRRRLRFDHLNLALDCYPSVASGTWGLDLILCRNVLIYFGREAVPKVAQRLFGALADGGWLITGPSDPPLSEHAPWETVVTSAGVFYRRGKAVPEPLSYATAHEPRERPPASPRPEAPAAVPPPTRSLPSLAEEVGAAFACGDYEAVLRLAGPSHDDPEVSSRHVQALANVVGPEAAERAAGEAVARHPLSPQLRFLHAVLLTGLGRQEQAAKAARRAIYLDRGFIVAHFTLGEILQRLGDRPGARSAYRNAWRLAAARPAGERLLPTGDERADRLAEAARVQFVRLGGNPGARP